MFSKSSFIFSWRELCGRDVDLLICWTSGLSGLLAMSNHAVNDQPRVTTSKEIGRVYKRLGAASCLTVNFNNVLC